MAVGKLLVELGASIGKFQSDMGRAAAVAEMNARKIDRSISSIKTTILSIGAGLGAAFSFNEAVGFVKETIAAASALDDLADATGSTVEELSRLKNVVAISGGNFEELQTLVLKVGKGIAGIDEEASKAAKALAFLGVTAKDPARAVQELAEKLDKYADGPGKIALMMDIAGKEGGKYLAVLKDVARDTTTLGTVTTEQAQKAEELEKAWRRLGIEATGLKNVILNDLVGALSRLIREFSDGIKIAGGFWAALANFGTINPFQSIDENLKDTQQKISDIETNSGAGAKWSKVLGVSDDVLDRLKKREQYLLRQKAALADLKFGASNDDRLDRLNNASKPPKPQLGYSGAKDGAKAAVAQVSEFDKIIEKLAKDARAADLDLAAAFSTEEITGAQKAIAALMADDSWRTFNEGQKAIIQGWIAEIDAMQRNTAAAKAERQEREKQIDVLERLAEEQARAKQAFTASLGAYADENSAREREIAIIGQDDTARQKLAATIEFERLQKQALAADDKEGLAVLEQQLARRMAAIDAYAAAVDKLNQTEQIRSIFSESFITEIGLVIDGTKSLSDAFKDMERSIVQSISRIAAQNIADAIFGKAGSSGGFGDIASWFGKLLSGAFAGGTSFAPGGMALVGERGPEIVNLPRGASVTPNNKIGGNVVNINVAVPGGTSRASADQIALQTGVAVRRAMARIG